MPSPVFCDVTSEHLLMDYADAAQRRTLRTKAIVPVLYGGRPMAAAVIRRAR